MGRCVSIHLEHTLFWSVPTFFNFPKKGKLYSVIRHGKSLLSKDMKKMLEKRFLDGQVREISEVKIADFATKVYVIVQCCQTLLVWNSLYPLHTLFHPCTFEMIH